MTFIKHNLNSSLLFQDVRGNGWKKQRLNYVIDHNFGPDHHTVYTIQIVHPRKTKHPRETSLRMRKFCTLLRYCGASAPRSSRNSERALSMRSNIPGPSNAPRHAVHVVNDLIGFEDANRCAILYSQAPQSYLTMKYHACSIVFVVVFSSPQARWKSPLRKKRLELPRRRLLQGCRRAVAVCFCTAFSGGGTRSNRRPRELLCDMADDLASDAGNDKVCVGWLTDGNALRCLWLVYWLIWLVDWMVDLWIESLIDWLVDRSIKILID